jgi:hypothetical protein
MAKDLTEKDFKKLVQKHIKKTNFVKVNLKDGSAIFGFIMKFSDHFMMIEETHDFSMAGIKIVPYDKVISIRHNEYDKVSKYIYVQENILHLNQDIINKTDLGNGEALFKSIKKQNFHCSIEAKKNKEFVFTIGEILEVDSKSVTIKNYNPAGKFSKKPHKISFKSIDLINFNDNYTKVFRKYLK